MSAIPSSNFYTAGPGNTFVAAATAQLQVEFSRSIEDFPLNRYAQIIPVEKIAGLYPEINTLAAVRVVTNNDFRWADGQEASRGPNRPLRWKPFACERYNYPYTIGSRAADTADFEVVASNDRMVPTLCMTSRTVQAVDVLTTAANWPATNYSATAGALPGGGSWYTSGTADQFIKNSIMAMKQTIKLQTGGVVNGRNLCLVINPVTAAAMGTSPEIQAYLVNHEQTMANLAIADPIAASMLDQWGLPRYLYGVDVCIEDAVKDDERRQAGDESTATPTFVMPDDKAVLTSQVGGLIGVNGVPSFSTLVGFFFEEMTAESQTDAWNRLIDGRVVDDRDYRLAAPVSGYLIDSVAS